MTKTLTTALEDFLFILHKRCWVDERFQRQRYETYKRRVLNLFGHGYDVEEQCRHLAIYEMEIKGELE